MTAKNTTTKRASKDAKDTRFRPGESGNPNGRPIGSGWIGSAREALQREWDGMAQDGSDGIRAKLIAAAKAGDMAAIRLVAERVCPPIKAVEPAATVSLVGETLTERANSVLAALGTGAIAPSQAAQLLQALGSLAKIIETDELQKRVAALEAGKQ